MISPNPKADSTTKHRLPALAPSMPTNALLKPKRPPLVIQESMTGPGLADTIKVIDKNRLKFVIGIQVFSIKAAILVEPLVVSQYKLGYLQVGFGFSSILSAFLSND